MKKQRDVYYDFLRGIAIIMVIGIHTYPNDTNSFSLMLLRNLIGCAVPLFLVISGFFLSKKNINDKFSYIAFLKKQVPKVYIPMLVWSMPLFLFDIYISGCSTRKILFLLIGGVSVYYFIILIIQYYVLLPILGKISIRGGQFSIVITLCFITFSKYVLVQKGLPLVLYAGAFPMWLMFFTTGILLGKMNVRKYSLLPWIIVMILGIVLMGAETLYLMNNEYQNPVGVKPSSHLYALAIIMVLFSEKVQDKLSCLHKLIGFVSQIGLSSFGIYLVHLYIYSFVIERFTHSWVISFVLTLLLSWGIVAVGKMLFPHKCKYLGFKI